MHFRLPGAVGQGPFACVCIAGSTRCFMRTRIQLVGIGIGIGLLAELVTAGIILAHVEEGILFSFVHWGDSLHFYDHFSGIFHELRVRNRLMGKTLAQHVKKGGRERRYAAIVCEEKARVGGGGGADRWRYCGGRDPEFRGGVGMRGGGHRDNGQRDFGGGHGGRGGRRGGSMRGDIA